MAVVQRRLDRKLFPVPTRLPAISTVLLSSQFASKRLSFIVILRSNLGAFICTVCGIGERSKVKKKAWIVNCCLTRFERIFAIITLV